ncbi:MAG: hypothetical protein Q7S74_02060 [Nanoarchaeota archaeon]|nr:hypothetical protein [Nanoarchaeota archaeon]
MTRERPSKIEIRGMEKDLGAILDSFVGNWRLKELNRALYRAAWEEYLPIEIYDEEKKIVETQNEEWTMAYVPRVCVRKVQPRHAPQSVRDTSDLNNWPYFILLLNTARDSRPQNPQKDSSEKKEDMLQKNILDKDMIISELEDFYLTPNGFPYHYYASLLISKNSRPQGNITPDDITTWIKFSFLTDQYVFFNAVHAGASQNQRFHAQVVDPTALRYEIKSLEYPILRASQHEIKRDVYSLEDYPVGALIFAGKDAPYNTARLVMQLEGHNIPYNVIVHGEKVYVVGRNAKRERSDCIGKNLGGYEISGVVLVGNVEEDILKKAGLQKVIHGIEVFDELTYEVVRSNIEASSIHKGWLKDLLT